MFWSRRRRGFAPVEAPPPPVFPVYVNHIPRDASPAHLRSVFRRYGLIHEVTILGEHGFVNFERPEEAEEAIRRANGIELQGSVLHVDFSQELADYLLHSRGRKVSFMRDPRLVSSAPKRSRNENRHERSRSRSPRSRSKHKKRSRSRSHRSKSRHKKRSRSRSRAKSPNRHEKRSRSRSRHEKKSQSRSPRSQSRPRISESGSVEMPEAANSVQEILIENLFNPVDEADIRRLLESYGAISHVEMGTTHAVVRLETTDEVGQQLIESLNENLWMDNKISVRSTAMKSPPRQETPAPQPENLNKQKQEEDEEKDVEPVIEAPDDHHQKLDPKIKTRTLQLYSATQPKTFMEDMTTIFSVYGKVERLYPKDDGLSFLVEVNSSERKALNCLLETNKLLYKGNHLRVKFEDGSYEDCLPFRRSHPVEFHDYPDPILPKSVLEAQMAWKKVLKSSSDSDADALTTTDAIDLPQEALLVHLRSSFGPVACLQGMMLLVSEDEDALDETTIKTVVLKLQEIIMKRKEKAKKERNDAQKSEALVKAPEACVGNGELSPRHSSPAQPTTDASENSKGPSIRKFMIKSRSKLRKN